MIPRQVVDFDARDAVSEAMSEFADFIKVSSRIIARDIAKDPSIAPDLVQEAAILLWELDPTRFDRRDAEYVRGAIYKRMQHKARRERRARGGWRRVEVGGL